jgi:DNA-binding NtrC family response regulator
MPARVAVVHDDPIFLNGTVSALKRAGYDVASFSQSMAAISALDTQQRVDILITRVGFPEGTPHGVALALMARTKRPGLKVLFTARPEMARHTEDIGEVLVAPVTAEGVLAKVREMLAEPTRLG